MFSLLSLSKLVAFVGTIFSFLWIFEYFVSNQANPENPWLLILTGSFAGILLLIINEIIPILFVPKHAEKIVKNLIFPVFIVTVIMYVPTKMFHNIFEFIGKKKKAIPVRKTKRWYALPIIHPKRNAEESHDEETELQILQNALHFRNIRARDCMVTRTEIVSVNIDEDINVLKNLFIEKGLSKILVYRNSEDNIVGYVHSFEMFKNPTAITQVLLPISFVPSAIPGKELLEFFAKQSGNMSVVVDEYGGTAGIVTIEDVIEEIFGEIEDEHDKEDWLEEQISPLEYRFSARADIDYLNETYKLNLPESESYETLAGLIFHELEELPEAGRKITIDEYELLVEQVSERKIEIVKITVIDE